MLHFILNLVVTLLLKPRNGKGMKDEKYLIELGKRIAELRKKKGWTQLEFAEKLNIQRTALTRIELGKVNSTINMLRKIAKALDVKMIELLDID